jgi:phosphotransferase system enzyme I (PtsI)
MAVLLGEPMPGIPHPGHPYVLVARDLSPADTATLDPTEVLALITELGGPTSHTAILAKGLGLPAVVQCAEAMSIPDGEQVIVDGSHGQITLDPGPEDVARANARATARRLLAEQSAGPGRTRDGHPVSLLVNIGTVDEALRAAAGDNEGVGLFRTEALFLERRDAPSLEEQTQTYTRVFAAFAPRKIVVRTLDAGADKPLAFVDHGHEENPALGVRGLRVATRRPDLLSTQLTALARAVQATGADVWVMAPMVAVPAEARSFRAQVESVGLRTPGVMVEIPAAALRAEAMIGEVEFVSIGTNDLTQYTMAADRMQGELSELLDPWQPAVLDLIGLVGAAGRRAGKPVGVCGEAGGDPLLALVLVGLGVTSLSMASGLMPAVRAALAAHTLEQCRAMAVAACSEPDAVAARAAVLSLADESTVAALVG